MKIKKLFFLFLLLLSVSSLFSQKQGKEKRNVNTYRIIVKVDVLKGIITRPQTSIECFFNDRFSSEIGASLLYNVNGAHDENTGYNYDDLIGLLVGSGKGYEFFGDIKYRFDKRHFYKNFRIYAGLGYAYRYVDYKRQWRIYKIASHGEDRIYDLESQTAYINSIRLTGGIYLGTRHFKHICFNPYIAVMPSVSKYHLQVDSLNVYDNVGGFRNVQNSNPRIKYNRTNYSVFFEVGFNICFGFGNTARKEE